MDFAFEVLRRHRAPDLIVLFQHLFRQRQEAFTFRCQMDGTLFTLEELRLEQVFQPLYLLADRCLGKVQKLSGSGHAAGLDDGHEGGGFSAWRSNVRHGVCWPPMTLE